MHLTWMMILNLFILGLFQTKPAKKDIFIAPVRIPVQLSANFGELRPDHYHSGIDIKTQGVTGKEVVAVADGYVSRISVSPSGFGRALYLTHPSGFSTVYGHLERFSPEIEEYVRNEQYGKKSFLITLFPSRDMFRFKQGDIIAYSGNSGSSGGPHLHYEIRRTDGEKPVNPLFFDFGATDRILPIIDKLAIYPAGMNSEINGRRAVKKLNVSGGHGNYYIGTENEIRISGQAGFGIKAYDLLDGSYNKCAVYSIELEIDSIRLFRYVMDSFSFTESKYINSHIDYETYMRENYFIERLYRLPNDRLSVYKEVINRGIFNFSDNELHHVKITVTDAHNNTSVLTFRVKASAPTGEASDKQEEAVAGVFPWNRANSYSRDDVSFSLPSGALYDTLYFRYEKTPGNENMYSDIHHIHDRFTPIHKPGRLSIKAKDVPENLRQKLLIASLGEGDRWTAINGTWNKGYVESDIAALGSFFVAIDTIAPEISPSGFTPGSNLSGRTSIKFRITDNFSGIKNYAAEIDGKWHLFEYDAKNSLLAGELDGTRLAKGKGHELVLRVTDARDNSATYRCSFTW